MVSAHHFTLIVLRDSYVSKMEIRQPLSHCSLCGLMPMVVVGKKKKSPLDLPYKNFTGVLIKVFVNIFILTLDTDSINFDHSRDNLIGFVWVILVILHEHFLSSYNLKLRWFQLILVLLPWLIGYSNKEIELSLYRFGHLPKQYSAWESTLIATTKPSSLTIRHWQTNHHNPISGTVYRGGERGTFERRSRPFGYNLCSSFYRIFEEMVHFVIHLGVGSFNVQKKRWSPPTRRKNQGKFILRKGGKVTKVVKWKTTAKRKASQKAKQQTKPPSAEWNQTMNPVKKYPACRFRNRNSWEKSLKWKNKLDAWPFDLNR